MTGSVIILTPIIIKTGLIFVAFFIRNPDQNLLKNKIKTPSIMILNFSHFDLFSSKTVKHRENQLTYSWNLSLNFSHFDLFSSKTVRNSENQLTYSWNLSLKLMRDFRSMSTDFLYLLRFLIWWKIEISHVQKNCIFKPFDPFYTKYGIFYIKMLGVTLVAFLIIIRNYFFFLNGLRNKLETQRTVSLSC